VGFLDTIRGRSVTTRQPEVEVQTLSPEQAQERAWRAEIARNEWVVQHVPARQDGTSPAFQYLAGLTERGLPEVVVYGLRMKTGTLVLDDLAWRLLNGDEFADGEPIADLVHGDPRAQLWDVTWLQDHLDAVLRLYGPVARVRQLVVSDAEGRLPWEDGFSAAHLEPVLFVPPNGRGPRRTEPAAHVPAAGMYSFGPE
jgi:Domain of unknown function (DUF4262)